MSIYRECRNNNLKKMIQIIEENDIDINKPNGFGETIISIACYNKNSQIVKYLLENPKLDVNCKNLNFNPLFIACCYSPCVEIVEILVNDDRIDINMDDIVGSPLHIMIWNDCDIDCDKYKIFKILFDHYKMNINILNHFGQTPFLISCRDGNINSFKLFVDNPKCDIYKCDNNGITPLMKLCTNTMSSNIVHMIERLVNDNNIDINQTDKQGLTAFHYLCMLKRFDNYNKNIIHVINLFLDDNRTDVNKKNNIGETAFYCACYKNNINIVKTLLSNDKIDVNICNNYMLSPFHIACLSGNYEIVKLLINDCRTVIKDVADFKLPDDQYIYHFNSDDKVISLLDNEYNIFDNLIKTINDFAVPELLLAIRNGNIDTIKKLLDDPDYDITNMNPFLEACDINNTNVIELLLKYPRVDVAKINKYNDIPIHCININNNDAIQLFLNDPRININIKSSYGSTLFNKIHYYPDQCVDFDYMLNSDNIDVNIPDNKGQTSFFNNCVFNRINNVKKMLSVDKIDVNQPNNDGLSPFHLSCLHLHIDIIKLLLNCERIVVTDFPENHDCRIISYNYTDEKYDELIFILNNSKKCQSTNIVKMIQRFEY